jgi:hypothetical protein
MLSARLIELIETHAESLTRDALAELTSNARTQAFRSVSRTELEERTFRLFRNLGSWIGDPQDAAVQAEYEEWGRRRYRQGIPLSDMIYALILLKHQLRRYIRDHGLVDVSRDRRAPGDQLPVHLHGVAELNYLVGEFFDRALYYLARGYEAEAQGPPPA